MFKRNINLGNGGDGAVVYYDIMYMIINSQYLDWNEKPVQITLIWQLFCSGGGWHASNDRDWSFLGAFRF